jgi:hypothetical protein
VRADSFRFQKPTNAKPETVRQITKTTQMKINIHRKNYNDLLRQNKIRWTLFTQKNIILFIIYAGLGLFYLVVTALLLKEGETFWGFGSSVGLSFIFLSIFYFSHTFRNKKKYLSQTTQYINYFNKQAKGIDITITDIGVTYKDFETFYEAKWSTYTHYKFYKDDLLLLSHNEYLAGLTINKNEITPDQFTELTIFIRKMLQERN